MKRLFDKAVTIVALSERTSAMEVTQARGPLTNCRINACGT
jgi:hypothetical protein